MNYEDWDQRTGWQAVVHGYRDYKEKETTLGDIKLGQRTPDREGNAEFIAKIQFYEMNEFVGGESNQASQYINMTLLILISF